MSALELSPRDLAMAEMIAERAAERAVELLRENGRTSASPSLLTAAEKAQQLSVSRDFVYRHQKALGAVRLPGGKGEVGGLRFPDVSLAATVPVDGDGSQPARPAPRRRRSTGAPGAVLRARPRLPQPPTRA